MRRDQGVSFALGIGAVAGVRVVVGVLVKMGSDTNGTYLRGNPLIYMNFFANIIAQI